MSTNFDDTNVNVVKYYNEIISHDRYVAYKTIPSYSLYLLIKELNSLFNGLSSKKLIEYTNIYYQNINPFVYSNASLFKMLESLLKLNIFIEETVLIDPSLSLIQIEGIMTTAANPCYVSDSELMEMFDLSGSLLGLSGLFIYSSVDNPSFYFDLNGPLATSYDNYLDSASKIFNTIESHITSSSNIYFSLLLFILCSKKILTLELFSKDSEFRVYRSRVLKTIRRVKTMMIEYIKTKI